MSELGRALDRLVPEPDGQGEWERVLTDAERRRRRPLAFALPVVAVAAVAVALALAWPFGGTSPTVLERALAAIGDGPVVHIVYRGEWGPMRVDLATGDVTPVSAESELWYDPKRGLNQIWRLGGKVLDERLVSRRDLSAPQEAQVLALADNYRTALKTGHARVIGPGRVGGRAVVWIRARSEWLPDVADGRNHLFAEEVAVDRKTYEPVYVRSTRDGRPFLGGGAAIAKLERMAAGSGDFDPGAPGRPRTGFMGSTAFGNRLRPQRFDDAVGGSAFWLGPSFRGRHLADASELVMRERTSRKEPWRTRRGLSLFYGKLRRRDGIALRALSRPRVMLEQFRGKLPDLWRGTSYAPAAQEGSLLIARSSGLVIRDGTYVSIEAPNVREVIEAAAALRRVGDGPHAGKAFDVLRSARIVEARQGKKLELIGGKPVRPRPIIKRGARPVQTGSGAGVTVKVYRAGAVTFDLSGLRPDLRRLVKAKVTLGCVKAAGAHGSIGGVLVPFRRRITVVLPGRFAPGMRPRPLKGRLDACEVGVGVGRNWFRRTKGHGLVEIPLTAAGRLFFDRRAAERRAS